MIEGKLDLKKPEHARAFLQACRIKGVKYSHQIEDLEDEDVVALAIKLEEQLIAQENQA